MGSAAEDVLAIDRRLRPEFYDKVDAIAEIIAPGAFAEWHNGISGEKHPPTIRQKYMQAVARRKAVMVLDRLGYDTDADWTAILKNLAAHPHHHEEDEDG